MDSKFTLSIIASLLLFLAVNVVLLDINVFSPPKKVKPVTTVVQQAPTETTCSQACKSVISDEITKQLSPSPNKTPSQFTAVRSVSTLPKEFFVPLGSGITRNDQWEEIAGAQATIDTSLYPTIKKVIFEANLKLTPGIGALQVKLYNATDKHDVWFSEVSSESDQSVRREATITLDSGSKQYQVYAKSSLRAVASVDSARIKIVTQ